MGNLAVSASALLPCLPLEGEPCPNLLTPAANQRGSGGSATVPAGGVGETCWCFLPVEATRVQPQKHLNRGLEVAKDEEERLRADCKVATGSAQVRSAAQEPPVPNPALASLNWDLERTDSF